METLVLDVAALQLTVFEISVVTYIVDCMEESFSQDIVAIKRFFNQVLIFLYDLTVHCALE